MGLHKLEIELTDDLISRIDKVSAATKHSRAEVVVETLRENLPGEKDLEALRVEERLAAWGRFQESVSNIGSGRSQEEIDRELQEIRQDRQYDV